MILWRKHELTHHEDPRGVIQEILPDGEKIASVLYCTGHLGAVRGNHVHKKDSHYCYVVAGSILYRWKPKTEDKVFQIELSAGDVVYTPQHEAHSFIFIKEGAFVAMATQPRTQASYEHDTKKINLEL